MCPKKAGHLTLTPISLDTQPEGEMMKTNNQMQGGTMKNHSSQCHSRTNLLGEARCARHTHSAFMVMLFTLLALFSLRPSQATEVNPTPTVQRQEQVVVFYLDEQFRPVTKLERLGPLSEGIKAILAMYALQVGGGCEGRDEHGVRCVLTTSLELGAQCSERHLSLVRSWFKKELPRMHGFSDQSIQRALKSGDLHSICYNAPHTATRQVIWEIIRIKKDNNLVFVDAMSHWTASSGGDGPSGQNRYQTEYRINTDTVTVVTHKELPMKHKDRQ